MEGVRNRTHKLVYFLILTTFVILFFTGCSSDVETKHDLENDKSITNDLANTNYEEDFHLEPVYDEELADILREENLEEYEVLLNTPSDYKPLEETSYKKLHSAFEANEISDEEYSKLLILLDCQPDLLPDQYKGAKGSEPINYAYQFISDNWDDLDASTRELLEPYLVPISDPKSYYFINDFENEFTLNNRNNSDKRYLIKTVNAAETTKVLVENVFYIDNQKFSIYYYEYKNWKEDKKLDFNMCVNDIEEAIIHSYDRFEQLLAISLKRPVIIELVPLKKRTNGKAWIQNGVGRIRLATANYDRPIKTQAVAAHELFHIFQYEIGLKFVGRDSKWLHEATAKWSENYAFEEYNTEHDSYLRFFFETLDRDRINFGDCFEYTGYMLFYYFSDYGEYDIVPEILWGTAREGPSFIREYLSDQISNSKEQYADYAFMNFNYYIAKEYYDHGDLEGSPNGQALDGTVMRGIVENKKEVTLNPGALQYYFYIFQASEDVQHVEFYFDKDFEDDKYIKRQAMVKIDGKWHLEDWSYVDQVKYCRLRELRNENVEAVILIYSNSNFHKEGTDNPVDSFKVKTERCPKEMDITIEAEYEYINDDYVWTANATLKDTVKITDHTFYISKNCNYSMEGSGELEGETIIESTGSYSTTVNDPNLENSMVRIIKPMDEELEDINEQLKDYGLVETTPDGGILITIPSMGEGDNLTGSTTIYLPEPEGEMTIDSALPFDGLNQAISIELDEDDWDSNGFNTEITLDYFSHKPAILDWYDTDFGQLQEMLSPTGPVSDSELDEINEILEESGLSMEDLEGMEGMEGLEDMLPSSDPKEDSSLTKTLDAVTSMMIPSSKRSDGISATIKLKIRGRYTEFN